MDKLTKEELIVIDKGLNILWEYGAEHGYNVDDLSILIDNLWSIWSRQKDNAYFRNYLICIGLLPIWLVYRLAYLG